MLAAPIIVRAPLGVRKPDIEVQDEFVTNRHELSQSVRPLSGEPVMQDVPDIDFLLMGENRSCRDPVPNGVGRAARSCGIQSLY